VRLRQVLEGEYGIKVPTGNRYPVDPVAVRSRVAERSTAGGDNDE
jgi:hypothetical protein